MKKIFKKIYVAQMLDRDNMDRVIGTRIVAINFWQSSWDAWEKATNKYHIVKDIKRLK